MKYKYKEGDKVRLKKSSDVIQEYSSAYNIKIKEVDKSDEALPYLVSFNCREDKKVRTEWCEAGEIKGYAKIIQIGGE